METLLSLNYERTFFSSKNKLLNLSVRTGFGFQKSISDSSTIYSSVVELSSLVGKGRSCADIGFGFVPNFSDSELTSPEIPEQYRANFFYAYTFRAGYRWDDPDRLIFLRVSALIHLRPRIPKSKTLVGGWGTGLSFGVYFGRRT